MNAKIDGILQNYALDFSITVAIIQIVLVFGSLAQLVEQKTLNLRVAGSSPARLIEKLKVKRQKSSIQLLPFYFKFFNFKKNA